MRFRKRVKVFPGFSLNFSSSGISSTLGAKGASINISKRGTYLNTSIPGTGLSNRQKISGGNNSTNSFNNGSVTKVDETFSSPQIPIGEIKSTDGDITSTSFLEFKDTLQEVYKDRLEITKEIEQVKNEIKSARQIYVIARIFLIGFFFKYFKNKVDEQEEYLIDLENQLKNSTVDIDVHFDKTFEEKYNKVINAYKSLLTTKIIWDITSAVEQDQKESRSAASTVVTRAPVKFKFENITIIKSTYEAFHFGNKNGGDLYIYPAFIMITNDKQTFNLIDIKEFDISFSEQRFLEEDKVPSDTEIIDKTWAKVNKNGSPDKRFAGNYEIPIVRYGRFTIKSKSGLNESYSFSSYEKSDEFVKCFINYQSAL